MDLELFNESLGEAFGPRLQISPSATVPHLLFVEEFVGSAEASIVANLKDKNIRQAMTRADARRMAAEQRAGIMMISRTPKITCRCGETLTLPIHENRETKCSLCGHSCVVSFWPLRDRLVSHFKKSDPTRQDQRYRVAKEDRERESLTYHNDRMTHNEGGAAVKDALIESLPTARLSGQTKMWEQE